MNVTMVFGIILAIIIVGFMLAVGGSQIRSIFCVSADAQVQKAIVDLEAMVEDVYWNTGEGSSRLFEVRLPGDSKLCFVDPSDPGPQIYGTYTWRNWNPDSILSELIKGRGYNMWFFQCGGEQGRTVKYLKVERNFCIIGGKRLYLENEGDSVSIDTEDG
jgi:hypothetical protein